MTRNIGLVNVASNTFRIIYQTGLHKRFLIWKRSTHRMVECGWTLDGRESEAAQHFNKK